MTHLALGFLIESSLHEPAIGRKERSETALACHTLQLGRNARHLPGQPSRRIRRFKQNPAALDFENLPVAAAGVVKQHSQVRNDDGRREIAQAARNTTPYRLRLDLVPALHGTTLDPANVHRDVVHSDITQRHIVAQVLGRLHRRGACYTHLFVHGALSCN